MFCWDDYAWMLFRYLSHILHFLPTYHTPNMAASSPTVAELHSHVSSWLCHSFFFQESAQRTQQRVWIVHLVPKLPRYQCCGSWWHRWEPVTIHRDPTPQYTEPSGFMAYIWVPDTIRCSMLWMIGVCRSHSNLLFSLIILFAYLTGF